MQICKHSWATKLLILPALASIHCSAVFAGDGGPRVFGRLLGGSGDERIAQMIRLTSGDLVVCGTTNTRSWTSPRPAFQPQPAGSADAFVAVLSGTSGEILHFSFYGGAQDDMATAVAVAADGTIVLVGETQSPGLPMRTGAYRQTFSNEVDGFVALFSPDLTRLERATFIPGSKEDHPLAAAIDSDGNIIVCGWTNSSAGFPVSSGYDRTYNGGKDAFAVKFDRSLSVLHFGTYFGSENDDEFTCLAIGSDGTMAFAGWTESMKYETYPTVDPQQWWVSRDRPYDWTFNGGTKDAVLTIFTVDGGRLLGSTYLGGSGADAARMVLFDTQGKLVVFGESTSSDFPSAGSGNVEYRGGTDIFVSVLGERGRSLAQSRTWGGNGNDSVRCAALVSDTRWLLGGSTNSTDLENIGAGTSAEVRGGTAGLLLTLSMGTADFASTIDGDGADAVLSLVRDSNADIWYGGESYSKVFSFASGLERTNGSADALVGKWAFGTIGLFSPAVPQQICTGTPLPIAWTPDNMLSSDLYTVEWSTDTRSWNTITEQRNARAAVWIPDSTAVTSSLVSIRVRSSRGHVVQSEPLVRVDATPTLQPLPARIEKCGSATIQLRLVAAGSDLRYQWKKGGVVLPQAVTSIYTIESLAISDTGTYTCVVTAGCGQVRTSSAVVVALSPNPEIFTQPVSRTAAEGATVVLAVEASNATSYHWRRLPSDVPIATGPTLTIGNAKREDAGTYVCDVLGECATVTSNEAIVSIEPLSMMDAHSSIIQATLAPNPPLANVCTIQSALPLMSVVVTDALGRHVLKHELAAGGCTAYTIDVSAFPAGYYWVRVDSGEGGYRVLPLVILK